MSFKFTTFCRQTNDVGTTHICTVQVEQDDGLAAAAEGLLQAAADWGYPVNQVKCIGVIPGDLQPVLWEEEGIGMPPPKTLQSIKIDFDSWPGAPFQGGEIIEIERGSFDSEQALEAAMEEVQEMLEDLADDDPLGPLFNRIRDHAQAMVNQAGFGQTPTSVRVVSPSGRYKLNEHGNPELYSGTSSPVLDESFDISVWVIPVFRDEAE